MLIRMLSVLLIAFFISGDDHGGRVNFFIRQAHAGDRSAIIELYKKYQNHYKDLLSEGCLASRQIVNSCFWSSLECGFSFVVEHVSDSGEGRIIAFLMKYRPCARSYRHVLSGGLSAIDPDFKREMLLTQLYQYLQAYVESDHPDILRIEGNCHARAYAAIAMFERCGFVLDSVRDRCVNLSDGQFVDELVFAWWNKNFNVAR